MDPRNSTKELSWIPQAYDWLVTRNFVTPLYSRGTDMDVHKIHIPWSLSSSLARRWDLQKTRHVVSVTVVWRHRGHGKHSFLYSCLLSRVYRAVAWQQYATYTVWSNPWRGTGSSWTEKKKYAGSVGINVAETRGPVPPLYLPNLSSGPLSNARVERVVQL
jgi:hypothetical protein